MRVGVITLGCDGGRSGIGKYAVALLKEMPLLAPDVEFVVAVVEGEESVFVTPYPNVRVVTLPADTGRVMPSLLWHVRDLPGWVRRERIDVLFCPAGNRRLPWRVACPVVGTVHDLSAFSVAAKYDRFRMFYIKKVLPMLIRRLTVPLTVSEHSKRDIVKYAHVPADRVKVVLNGFESRDFVPVPPCDGPRYWLYVSRIEHPGKNHARLIEAYERLAQSNADLPLLYLAGGDWDGAADVHARHESSPVRDQIKFLGYVPDKDLPGLVAHAEAVVYPSLYEGFGIPLLEAMACGVPVASSNTSSLPEVGGDAALYFDPTNVDDIVTALRRLLNEPELRKSLSERGLVRAGAFPWEKCASETFQILSAVSDNR